MDKSYDEEDGKGWIGVDLDGTLAHHDSGDDIWKIGKPIKPMVDRINKWMKEGTYVKIVTARVAESGYTSKDGICDDKAFADKQRKMITNWLLTHIGWNLDITATKDFAMIQLWDDRAVQVIKNTGIPTWEENDNG